MTGGNGIDDKGGTGYGITRGEYTWAGGCITVTADNIDFTVRREIDTRVFRNKAKADVLSGRKNNDVSIQYVATEAGHRRRGLASRLLLAVMADPRGQGRRSATLQASADGLPVYRRLGFGRVAALAAADWRDRDDGGQPRWRRTGC